MSFIRTLSRNPDIALSKQEARARITKIVVLRFFSVLCACSEIEEAEMSVDLETIWASVLP